MASWTKRNPVGVTNRRKWNLEDRSSLNNLKYHFAADGCADIQYDLGRQLLESTSESDGQVAQTQGVHWLLCAAQQGHEKALDMLRDCYQNKRGINDTNKTDVKMCLSMSSAERAARKAARELFICLSNGGEHITPNQLEQKMLEIYNVQKSKQSTNELSENYSEHIGGKRHNCLPQNTYLSENGLITEASLIMAAVNYSHGQLPSVSQVLTLSMPNPNSLDHIPCFHRILFHPVVFFTLLYHNFIRKFSSFPGTSSFNVRLILLFMIYMLISCENLTIFLPVGAYYFSFVIMVCSTFRMLKTKHDFIDFRMWSGLFLNYSENVDTSNSENQFLRNNMKPYLYFFLAFIVNLISYPIISMEWLPNSEITVISFLFVFLTMIAFMYTAPRAFPDFLVFFSFGMNVLAKYPYEMDSVVATGWRYLDLKFPTFCSFIIGNGIEFCLNCRAALYLFIPGFLIQLAKRSNWHGTYIYLLPHCVTLSWLHICIISSQYATMFGLMRAALGLAGILLFLPLFGVITLMVPVFVSVEWLGLTGTKLRMVTTLLATSFAILISCLMVINQRTRKYVTFLQVVVSIIAAALLILPYMTSGFSGFYSKGAINDELLGRKSNLGKAQDASEEPMLSWESFYKHCGQPTSEHMNKIRAQLECSFLEYALVRWEGTISAAYITKVSNYRATFVKNYLPSWLGNLITCYFGDRNDFMCGDSEHCSEVKIFGTKRCNLNKWNIYEYEIKVRMQSGILSRPSEVYLKASHQFENFTRNVIVSDRVWFKGRLLNTKEISNEHRHDMILGAGKPVIELIAIGCITCQDRELTPIILTDKENLAESARIKDLMRGVKYFLNVILNPLITFK